jgi:WD40 repeat protein
MLVAAIALLGLPNQEPPVQPDRRLTLIAQSSTNRLEDIAVNADETRILTHDRNYAPRLWDRKTMRLLKVLDGHTRPAFIAEFSLDGRRVLSVSASEAILWDSKFGREVDRIPYALQSMPQKGFTAEAISGDSRQFVIGSSDGDVTIVSEGAKLGANVKLFEGEVTSIQCASSAKVACAGDDQGRVAVFSLESAAPIASFETGSRILWVRIDRTGKHVVATTIDERAHLFDVEQRKLLRSFDHNMGTKGSLPLTLMASLFVGAKGDQLLVAEQSGTMRLYDVDTGKVVGALTGHTEQVREIRQSVDGTKVATYGDDEQLKIWDVTGQKELPFTRGPGSPTAGEFSVDGSAFWLGFSDGSLRRHDTKTGEYDSEAVGQTSQTYDAVVSGRWVFFEGQESWLFDALNPTAIHRLGWYIDRFTFSPNGEKALWKTPFDDEYYVCDVASGTPLMRYLNCLGARFTRDSKYLVTWHVSGDVNVWRTSDGEQEKGWTIEKDKPRLDIAVSPTEDLVASLGEEGDRLQVWNYLTGDIALDGDVPFAGPKASAFSRDGETLGIACMAGVGFWKPKTGDYIGGQELGETLTGNVVAEFSPDGKWFACAAENRLIVTEAGTGKLIFDDSSPKSINFEWSGNNRIAFAIGNKATVLDPGNKEKATTVRTAETISSLDFNDDGTRILTTDDCEGLVIWELPDEIGGEPRRLGNFVQMIHDDENSWLATDAEGRYDATDPANVSGAHYVLEWSGGLETIAVEQLKDQFFEPGLLAKILGVDPEDRRPVPALSALKLYPSLDVSVAKSGALRVSIEDRDDGGVGVLRAWVNGKQVFARNNPPGFFEVEPSTFERYFLPSNLLPEGQGNLVRFSVTNKAGDLESPPVTVDVGVPADLRPPEVKMYALFVGLNNYVGSIKDLSTPASDARELEMALRTVGNRLLPGRVQTTLLTSSAGKEDTTRTEILAWFDQVAAKATASDIVIVYFSGHGVNEIAGVQDYFFLTPEADPTSVGALTATTAAISGAEISAKLAKIAASKQVVILDTCHSGAFATQLASEKSVSGDYRRAWQAIRDATGTWMLAGSAADQKSFESTNVGHGILTYSLLEAIDRASAQGLRQTESGELFVDVERWIDYAAARVESLKNEVGVTGVQRPQVARSAGSSFDIGVMQPEQRGFIGLKAPRPIVIMGEFDQDKEDPLRIEQALTDLLKGDDSVTVWTDVTAHPRAFRLTGSYTQAEGTIKATVYLQRFGEARDRKTIAKFDIEGKSAGELVALIRVEALKQIAVNKDAANGEIKTGGG